MLKELLEKKDGTKDMLLACLEIVRSSNRVIVFGAGVGGRSLYQILVEHHLEDKIEVYTDNNELKCGKCYMSETIMCIKPNLLMDKVGSDCTVIVTSSAYDSIKKQLISYGFLEEQIFLFNFSFMNLEYTDSQFIWNHIMDFERAYKRMQDDKSRRIFVNILNYKITKDVKYLNEMQADVDDVKNQYFPIGEGGLWDCHENEVFLDIGAYTGDTLNAYDIAYKHSWKGYYGVEADKVIYDILDAYIKEYFIDGKKEIQSFNLAAWDESTVLYFDENPGDSRMNANVIDNTKMSSVTADALDNVLTTERVSFVKMDIEGAEYHAINGMKKIIQRNKPILAICVYHLRDDFYKLTDLIESIMPNEYAFYFRQYRYTPTETVCYAIPRERRTRV